MPDNKPASTPQVHPSNIAANAKSSRERLSPAPLDPMTGRSDPSQMKPHQAALRQAVVDSFNAKKARTFLQKQVHHISTNRELADGIKFLFDEHGRPPNMPIEDIVEERRMVEYHLMWVEGVLNELRHRLIKIKEVEDYAFEMLARAAEKNK
ncbi:MAG: hypothetical protein U1F20_10270 [Lysobacterales bacterium]